MAEPGRGKSGACEGFLRDTPKARTKELATLLQEAAATVNNTPMWEVPDHPDDPAPLSPATLLTLKDSPNPQSAEIFTEEDMISYGPKRWRRIQYLASQFWTRWRKYYIQNLQKRNKWRKQKVSIKRGVVVLIRNKNEKRNVWPMARVEECIKDTDGTVRSVKLILPKKSRSTKTLHRSIHDLVYICGPISMSQSDAPGEKIPLSDHTGSGECAVERQCNPVE